MRSDRRVLHYAYTFPPGGLLAGTWPMYCLIPGPRHGAGRSPRSTADRTQVTCQHCLAKLRRLDAHLAV